MTGFFSGISTAFSQLGSAFSSGPIASIGGGGGGLFSTILGAVLQPDAPSPPTPTPPPPAPEIVSAPETPSTATSVDLEAEQIRAEQEHLRDLKRRQTSNTSLSNLSEEEDSVVLTKTLLGE